MPLPPITAQIIDIPPDLAQLGSVGIMALSLFGMVLLIRPLLKEFVSARKDAAEAQKQLVIVNNSLLNALQSSDRAQDRAADEIAALRKDVGANQDEARTASKAQSEALSMLVKSQTGIMDQFASQSAAFNAHDTFAREGVARLEAQGARLIEMVESGQKVSRTELAQLSHDMLAAIRELKPTPPTPPTAMHVVPKPEPPAENVA